MIFDHLGSRLKPVYSIRPGHCFPYLKILIQIKFVHVFVSLIMIMLLALDRFIVISARNSFQEAYCQADNIRPSTDNSPRLHVIKQYRRSSLVVNLACMVTWVFSLQVYQNGLFDRPSIYFIKISFLSRSGLLSRIMSRILTTKVPS